MLRKFTLGLLALGTAIALASPVLAMTTLPGEPEIDEQVSCDHAVPSDEPLAAGRVVAVDSVAGRITLEYRPIPQLFLEGGTRIFAVEDPSSLKGLGPGDKVRFDVERDGRRYIVTYIENSN